MFIKGESMDIQATKLDILQSIINVNKESLLLKIKTLIDDELIVGYSTSGEPLTKKEYNKQLEESEKQIENGEYLSHEELKQRIKNW